MTEWVDILGSRSKLSDSEISEYLLASAKLHATSSEQTSPAEELDLLQQQYCQWLPQMKSALTTNKKLLAYSLNHICAEQGIPLVPERTWTGDFPTYRANDGWEVNLSSLRVSSLQGKVLPVSWPTEILANPDFKEVFPSFDPLLHPCYFSKKREKCYYQSTDTQGRTHLVEQQPDGTLSFFLSGA